MRKIKQNIFGNWNGYIGRRRVQEFGTNEVVAGYWLNTGIVSFLDGYAPENYAAAKAAVKAAAKAL